LEPDALAALTGNSRRRLTDTDRKPSIAKRDSICFAGLTPADFRVARLLWVGAVE